MASTIIDNTGAVVGTPEGIFAAGDLHSQQVQDIISERPGFWGSWALPIFLVIILLLVSGTWFLWYPDTLTARAVLTSPDHAKVYFQQENFGRLATGQTVQLRFAAYPYEEFGAVMGRLEFISDTAVDSGFWGIVALPGGLTTTYRQKIPFRNGLQASAVIVIKQMRLAQRFYYNMIKKSR